MAKARRSSERITALVLLGAGMAGACLVKDVELVDDLPGAPTAGSSTGGKGNAGSPSSSGSQNEGGDGPGAAGTESGGTATGGSAGSDSGGTAQGGSAGSNPGGSAGTGGTGMGSPTEIPDDLLDCNAPELATAYVCADFESELTPQWPPGTAPEDIVDAPSGNRGLVVDYTQTYELPVDLTAMSISFWVRFPSPTDQRFVSFEEVTTLQQFGIGIEHERARWIYADMSMPAVAPELNSLTRVLSVDTWVCVQMRVDLFSYNFEASVVVPGDPPVALPVLDQNATAGADEAWNLAFPNWTANSGSIIFGQVGVYQEFDDVLIGDFDAQTLCEKFAALAN